MAEAVPRQHPAVVLRSHYTQLRALLVVAMIAVVGLTAAVVVLATDDGTTVLAVDTPALSSTAAPGQAAVRSDSGPDETAVGAAVGSLPSASPDESSIASSIGRGSTPPTGGSDESKTAAAIAGR